MGAVTAAVPLPEPLETTRERLIAAAIGVFLDQGFESARVHDIARAAGLTTGAIYANYRGKGELLFDAMGRRANAEVSELLDQAPGSDARDLLERLGARLLYRPDEQPTLLPDALAAARRDPDLAEMLRERLGAREAQIGDLVERAKRDGAIDTTVDTDALARFCLTLATGALVVRTLGLDAPDQDDWQALIHRLIGAIAPKENQQ